MKKGKSKKDLRIDWSRRELIRNLEAIFKEGSKLYPLMDEKEVCDKIMTLPQSKAPKNKAELFMVMAANHAKNEQWANENPEPVELVNDLDNSIPAISDQKAAEDLTTISTLSRCVGHATASHMFMAGLDSSNIIRTSEKNSNSEDGNSPKREPDSGSGTPS